MSLYYRDANAALIVFDYSNKKTLESIKFWRKELSDKINTEDIILKIVGNKYDLVKEDAITDSEIHEIL